MFNYFRKELDWGGRKLVLETGKVARQADGAVLASYGDTIVLCTVVGAKTAKAGAGFLPADRELPGKDLRRRQDSRAASSSAKAGRPRRRRWSRRLIDRPIRPLFPDGFRNEVQVIATVLSHDLENDPDIVALVGCLGGADHLRHSVLRPGRRGPRRLYRRRVRAEPDPTQLSTRSSTSSSPAPPKAC